MLSTLIDFLMNLLRDDEAKVAFAQDPHGTLAKSGLEGVSGQDVRDARLIMADGGGARARDDGHRPASHDNDPVREIHHTTRNFEVDEQHTVNNVNVVNIDDRDTILIDDSFNSDDDTEVDSTAIQDNSTNTDIDIVKNGDPTNPTDPANPAEPGDPAEPGNPAEPDEPTEPDEPEPVEDDEPIRIEPVESDPVEDAPISIDPVEDEPDLELELAEPLVG